MTVDVLKNILNWYFEIDNSDDIYHLLIDSEWVNEFAQEIIQSMNEPLERAEHILNVGDPVIVGGYISKIEVLTDVVRYYLENGAVIEMERKQ